MILTVDIGNSRIKWALWGKAMRVAYDARVYDSNRITKTLDEFWSAMEKPASVMISCVAGEMIEQAVLAWIKQHWQLEADVLRNFLEGRARTLQAARTQ